MCLFLVFVSPELHNRNLADSQLKVTPEAMTKTCCLELTSRREREVVWLDRVLLHAEFRVSMVLFHPHR